MEFDVLHENEMKMKTAENAEDAEDLWGFKILRVPCVPCGFGFDVLTIVAVLIKHSFHKPLLSDSIPINAVKAKPSGGSKSYIPFLPRPRRIVPPIPGA